MVRGLALAMPTSWSSKPGMNWPEPTFTRDVGAGAALERRAVDRAGEVDHDAVAGLDLGALAFRRVRLVLLGDLFDRSLYSALVTLA